VRYTVFGCGNRDWASDLPGDPASDRRAFAAKGAERIYVRARATPRRISTATSRPGTSPCCGAADKLGVTLEADAGGAPEPLYQVQPVDQAAGQSHHRGTGALPMRVLGNRELQTPTRRDAARGISR